ncbi:unnamed protein product [Didymodactylos carnosus]|uniref:Uncharacterized protein n=1 Tax=Didymodactylos carnosus TaxID=1234261 RepID=A0A814U8I4_9BILA|nr:unnamed protein product [Didymodactylos carnosus]CAF3932402.1 unnamed protein product [Didymodactylos carnosus]
MLKNLVPVAEKSGQGQKLAPVVSSVKTVNFITKEIEQKVGAEMSGGGLAGSNQGTGGGGFLNQVESAIDGMSARTGNAPNVDQPGGGGGIMNELEKFL